MGLLLGAVALLVVSGLAALAAQRSVRWCTTLGVAGLVAACLLGVVSAVPVLLGAASRSVQLVWDVPYGSFSVALDPLSALFLLPIFALSAAAAVYGGEFLSASHRRRSLGPPWFFFNVLVASMVLVVIARNGVLFLVAWEVMALASFFLVTFEDEKRSVREAGWIYLVAAHLGTACLLVLFILLGRTGNSLDFDHLSAPPALAGVLFLLAVIGFGTKAGFMPFHVWLPEAHPAAPSHVSAVMSGVMIKTGIYGLIRMLMLLGPPPTWWGWMLCTIGLTSGILGVLSALAQHDLKRLLAYSSVENIGIIALGLGIGVVGLSAASPMLAVLGFTAALLHVVNHAVFKGLLFLGAGAVAHAAGTREIDRLGGLLKRMPWTGTAFLTGAAAISGLPPLNGFVGEFLLYLGAFRGVVSGGATLAVPLLCAIAGLALIGGLAVACFTKASGFVFLGEPRSSESASARDPGRGMRLPMLLLAAGCVLIGCLAPIVVPALAPAVAQASGLSADTVRGVLASAERPLWSIAGAALGLYALIALVAGLRWWLLSSRLIGAGSTWDCGYAQPSPRMQYTGSSFAQPLTDLFALVLQPRRALQPPEGFFPSSAALATETPDVCSERLYAPVFSAIGRGLSALRWLQHGRVHLYILYIALTLVVLFVWKLG